jgi:hypothetical protein
MLTTLREKPHHIKQIVSFVITVVIFSGIVFVWWSSRDARSRELEVQEKTVSPISGVTSMFDGFVANFIDKIKESSTNTSLGATSTQEFDLDQVMIIDPTATATIATSTQER